VRFLEQSVENADHSEAIVLAGDAVFALKAMN
jgi:hypothetical protein